MPRAPRTVVAQVPHHVTQRGARRLPTFFEDSDYTGYLSLLQAKAVEHGVRISAYCLMPNHVHLSATPLREDSLARAFGQCHWRHAWRINRRKGWTGHLWQERFYSCAMDPAHTWVAIRYMLFNPVRSGLVERPEDWRWSSARSHLGLADCDPLISEDLGLDRAGWAQLFGEGPPPEDQQQRLRESTRSGRPLGDGAFVARLAETIAGDHEGTGKTMCCR